MTKLCFLEEERLEILSKDKYSSCSFVSKSNLKYLSCDILFVKNKINLSEFIKFVNHNILETLNIKYIVVEDFELLDLINNNFEDILITKWDEDYKSKNTYKFFRIGDKKLYTIIKNFRNYYYVPDKDGEFEDLHGNKCSRCFDYWADNVKTYEKDINKFKRFALLSAKHVKFKKNYRVANFDIETNASVDCIDTPGEIISLAVHDNLKDEIKYWDLEKMSEKKMLEEFFDYIAEFDVLVGFNIQKFDMPYLLNRAAKVGVDTSRISKVRAPVSCKYKGKDDMYPWFVKIIGLNIVDLFQSSVRATAYLDVKLPDNKLNTLAKYILGESKYETDTPAILYKNREFDKLKEYNIQDVKIAVKLDNKLGIVELLIATLEFVPGLNLEDANYNSKIIDFYLLSKFDCVLPTVNRNREKDIKGAIVFDPDSGIHENVAVYDIASMYPSLIRTFNISPDTICDDGEIKIGNVSFSSKKKGILVKVVDEFSELRERYKRLKKENEGHSDYKLFQLREFATKKILVSFYGVFGYIGFRLFDNRIANAITESGRDLLNYMKTNAEENDYDVVSGDTDSIFVKKYGENNNNHFYSYEKILNNSMSNYMKKYTKDENIINNHCIKIELETLFSKIIIPPAKKKYIGMTIIQKGKKIDIPQLYFKGSELNKKDVPAGLKEKIKTIVLSILKSDDEEDDVTIIKNEINKIRSEIYFISVEDLLIYKEITRDFDSYKVKPQHVRAAENSNKYLNTNFSREDYRGGVLYVKSNIGVEVLFMNDKVKLDKKFKVDYEKYYEKFILEKIKLIFGDYIYKEVTNKNYNLNEWLI